jgi:hypothetical protein
VSGLPLSLGLALLAAGLFLALATGKGETSWAGRAIGAGWVFLLTAIILMPILVPKMKGDGDGRRMSHGRGGR